ncbi:MAG: hypothetical protein M3Z50_06720 [Actinomycetota bacterium]|nr:hypothetical protein [Actinomycetota bacterium]
MVADTREKVAVLNAAIRDALVTAGRVDDTTTATTAAGERIGVGDQVVTRRNDPALGVANREVWTVTATGPDGSLTITADRSEHRGRGHARAGSHHSGEPSGESSGEPSGEPSAEVCLPAAYASEWVELAYASTVYGAQGESVDSAHLVLGEHTGAAAGYVGMTRGREANTAHLVAEDLETARDQWIGAFGRDRADLGPAHAAQLAAAEADNYVPTRPLNRVLADLRAAWAQQADLHEQHEDLTWTRNGYRRAAETRARYDPALDQLAHAEESARGRWLAARERAEELDVTVAAERGELRATTWRAWQADQPGANHAAATIRGGTGRFGKHRAEVRDARTELVAWAEKWRPVVPYLTTDPDELAAIDWTGGDRLRDAVENHITQALAQAHPGGDQIHTDAENTWHHYQRAEGARDDITREFAEQLHPYEHLYNQTALETKLDDAETRLAGVERDLSTATDRVNALCQEPAIRTLPVGRLEAEHDTWQLDRDQDRRYRAQAAAAARVEPATTRRHHPVDLGSPGTGHSRGPGIGF